MALNQVKKIVLITSTQLSLNPRLVKEADALTEDGYDVTVLYAYWNKWGAGFDKVLISAKKWKAICIGGDPEHKPVLYFLSRLIHKAAKIVNHNTNGKVWADFAIARSGFFLKRAARKYPADIYIGHNQGALPATIQAAKTNNKRCGFDAEDFHRNELSDDKNDPGVMLRTYLENKYFSKLDYLTVSSPQIATVYRQLFPDKNPVALLNVFPSASNILAPAYNSDGPVKLFWFSQTIGIGRGLEEIIEALQLLKEIPFEFHLLGYLSSETKKSFIDPLLKGTYGNIYFHDPIPSDQIIAFASQFDLGLALERHEPYNRDICLTNKLFTCMQAGLAIVASDTIAQNDLLNQYAGIGKIYQKGNPRALANVLLHYHENRDQLFETRKAAFKIAREQFNWEKESKKLLTLVKQTINSN